MTCCDKIVFSCYSSETKFGIHSQDSSQCTVRTTEVPLEIPTFPEPLVPLSPSVSSNGASDDSELEEQSKLPQKVAGLQAMKFAICAEQGKRKCMEDRTVAVRLDSAPALASHAAFFGVFDGHAGHQVAEYISEHIIDNLCNQEDYLTNPSNALKNAIYQTEAAWELHATTSLSTTPSSPVFGPCCPSAPTLPPAGSTALAALLLGTDLYLGNVGDCRAVLCREFRSKQLTTDHKWSNEGEKARITQAGCHVTCDGYVAGEVAVTRALGLSHLKTVKPELKAALTCEPELVHIELEPEDEFLVLASDGLWDKLQNGDVVRIARNHLQHNNDPAACAQCLVDEALRRGADDNISVIIVCFKEKIAMRRSSSVLRLNCRS